jgi:glycosyltransferase involved in cell wall biosynthesis
MPKVLVIRFQGSPFHIRMSKVLRTILDSGWQCDILYAARGIGNTNVSKEMGRDLSAEVVLREFPAPDGRWAKLRRWITAEAVFGSQELEASLLATLRQQRYDLLWVKDSPCLPLVFRCLERAGQADTRVVCDMYENAAEQLRDSLLTFGDWRSRWVAHGLRLLPRVCAAEARFLPRCDRIFVVVEEIKSWLLDQYKLDPARLSVVHNVEILADFDQIKDIPLPLKEEEPLLSFVGGFGVHRGIELLIEATRLVANCPHPPFRVALVGASRSEMTRLDKIIQDNGVQDHVTLVESQPHRVAMQWMKRSQIGLIPHLDTMHIRTTIPNKLFQYMAAGVGSIVSDVGPLGRIVRETGCGRLFRPGDAEELAAQISFALAHPDQMQQMGAKGRASAEQRYCWEVEGQEYARYLLALRVAIG